MPFVRRSLLAVLAAVAIAGSAHATEYVVSGGIALPERGRSEFCSMAGVRHVLARGVHAEGIVVSSPGGPAGSGTQAFGLLAYAKPAGALRAGAGVLALRSPEFAAPSRPALIEAAGFQLACGVQMPLAAGMGIDLDARYVRLESRQRGAAPERFATRFWTVTLGLALLE